MLRVKEMAIARGFKNINQLALQARIAYPQAKRYWNNQTTEYHTEALQRIADALQVPVWALHEGAPTPEAIAALADSDGPLASDPDAADDVALVYLPTNGNGKPRHMLRDAPASAEGSPAMPDSEVVQELETLFEQIRDLYQHTRTLADGPRRQRILAYLEQQMEALQSELDVLREPV
jgi:hypothetical protein